MVRLIVVETEITGDKNPRPFLRKCLLGKRFLGSSLVSRPIDIAHVPRMILEPGITCDASLHYFHRAFPSSARQLGSRRSLWPCVCTSGRKEAVTSLPEQHGLQDSPCSRPTTKIVKPRIHCRSRLTAWGAWSRRLARRGHHRRSTTQASGKAAAKLLLVQLYPIDMTLVSVYMPPAHTRPTMPRWISRSMALPPVSDG